MRYLLTLIISLLLVSPAMARTVACEMEGPHNCLELNDDALAQVTRNTINKMEMTRDPHPFKTQNDVILEKAARQTAQLREQNQNLHPDWAFWRK